MIPIFFHKNKESYHSNFGMDQLIWGQDDGLSSEWRDELISYYRSVGPMRFKIRAPPL